MHSYPSDTDSGRRLLPRSGGALRYIPSVLTGILAASLILHAGNALSAGEAAHGASASAPSSNAGAKLDTVTIEAARERQLRHRVRHFLSSVVVSYMNDSLPRWDEPICPLVAGLPREQGEYILARISQVAAAAHAPLAGEHCKANLLVVATPYPDLLLKKWKARDTQMYNNCNGLGGVDTFLHSRQPVRVWYNTMPGGPMISLDAPSIGLSFGPTLSCAMGTSGGGSRLTQGVLALSQAIIVVDIKQTKGLTIGQLADYVSMVGLAQIQPDAHPRAEPTILALFEDEKHAPQALSSWDQAFLDALYNTNPGSVLQVSLIERKMVSQIAPLR